MIITNQFDALPAVPRIYALGNFDGVHLGHQSLLRQAVALARHEGGVAIALAFSPHPSHVLGHPVPAIVSERQKVRLIADLGIDVYFALPFDRSLAMMPPQAFVESILVQSAKAQRVVVGFDYSFGKDAAGTSEFLQDCLQLHDIEVTIMPPVLHDGDPISSTRIRQYLRCGELEKVHALLGRSYSLTGIVQPGDQRGRIIGFPTANLTDFTGLLLPPFGVYAVEVVGLGYGMANLGVRPSFPQSGPTLEVHLFDFAGDLYGQELEVCLRQFVRGERLFASVDELKHQLQKDEQYVRSIVSPSRRGSFFRRA